MWEQVSRSTAAVTRASGHDFANLQRAWLVRHTGLWSAVSTCRKINMRCQARKSSLAVKSEPLECIRGREKQTQSPQRP